MSQNLAQRIGQEFKTLRANELSLKADTVTLSNMFEQPSDEIVFKGNLVPAQGSTFSIGSADTKVKDLFLSGSLSIGPDGTIDIAGYTFGSTQFKVDNDLRVDGNVTLGLGSSNTVTIRGTTTVESPITFKGNATLGDGNDSITVNAGSTNNFLINAKNVSLDASGTLTGAKITEAQITDLKSYVTTSSTQALKSTGALTKVGNVMYLNKADGSSETVDLTMYLDDTNLARIISGTYNAASQSLVFTRDDGSTFSVDSSMFFDDTNLVTSVAGKTGAVALTKADVGLGSVDNTSDANKPISTATQTALDTKVDKVAGKKLSTEDYTSAEKTKLAGIAAGANAYTHPDNHPASIITQDENNRFVTDNEKLAWDAKQDALVSGTNIKTINGESLLGKGDVVVTGSGGGGPTLQGDTALYVTQTKTYQITNFNSFSSYTVSTSAGTASISGDTITFAAPATAGNVSLTLAVDGQPTAFVINVQASPLYIPTPTPTPANFGDPFEGGFYYGMTWEALSAYKSTTFVTCSQSKTLSTGTHAFTINVDMAATPVVYAGQTLEVRSRANPNNKFIGTVTNATGNVITLNVTSISGSGTFSDWSFMSRYRLIAAPKASGENAGIRLKNANTALPTACQTLTEGWAATMAMFTADTSTVYPAAHWARNLVINGFDDFFIPARDQLEPCWRNLKPVTNNNYTTANRPTGASFSYANNGSYGDTANTHGLNNNSAPTGAAYTAAVPAQTAAAAFRTGGTEAYEFGSAYYWSSSDYNTTFAWHQYWSSSNPGYQLNLIKYSTPRVRAVRRSII
jgi:hypothetical protein